LNSRDSEVGVARIGTILLGGMAEVFLEHGIASAAEALG
jgi:hypothetical protein